MVASEVKELAAQTSRATEDVAAQIRAMQDSTGASVGALRSIAGQIKELERQLEQSHQKSKDLENRRQKAMAWLKTEESSESDPDA